MRDDGQVAIEYLVMVGIVLALIVPLSLFVWQQSETETRVRQGELAANAIAAAADNLWAQGPGAKTTLTLYFPAGYEGSQSRVFNNTIQLRVYTPGNGNYTIGVGLRANVSGSLPSGPGYRVVTLELVTNSVVIS